MNSSHQEQEWEQRFRASLGSAPSPDFATWSERHSEALTSLVPTAISAQPDPVQMHVKPRRIMTVMKIIAASVLLAVGIVWFGSSNTSLGPSAFADMIPGVDDVGTMTWTVTYYSRLHSDDGKRTWIQKERRLHAYRHPGQYRETMLNHKGEVMGIHITDVRAGRMLTLDVKGKKAVLKMPATANDERPPFAYVGDIVRRRTNDDSSRVKSLSLLGQKTIDSRKANVVRAIIQSNHGNATNRMDIMFDVTSKQLVGIWGPNEPDFDYETSDELKNPPGDKWQKWVPVAALHHEFVTNPKIEQADFSLDPPAGYAFEKIAAPTVTEEEILAYLGAAARYGDNSFPDSPFDAFDRERLNADWEKDDAARSPEANALIEIVDRIRLREIYSPPVRRFIDDHTEPESFCYVGSGVKVGQSDRIVCWYKLRVSGKYRAIHGDLSVKDVKESDLPLHLPK